jgi:VWFA-related protein
MRRALILMLVALGTAVAVRADDATKATPSEDQTPAFPAQVEQVTVDVVVADKQGNPITGLKRKDFTLAEDDAAEDITSFEAINVAPQETPEATSLQRRVSSNSDAVRRNARTFVIVFDGLHLTPASAATARKSIQKFMDTSLRDDDYVMLLGTQSATWISTRYGLGRDDILAALKRQKGTAAAITSWDYMSPYEALRVDAFRDVSVGERVARRWRATGYMLDPSREEIRISAHSSGANPGTSLQPGTIDPLVSHRAFEVRRDSRVREDATMALLRRMLDSLATVKGRKSVLLVSEGFVVDLDAKENQPVREAAQRANAAVYFIDARGLMGVPAYSTAQWSNFMSPVDSTAYIDEAEFGSEGARSVAADSGGFTVRNGNDLAGAMDRIARESQSYYLLGYYPKRTTPDGKFHAIKVSVDRKDVVVRARRGYYATAGESEVPAETVGAVVGQRTFQAAVDSPYELDNVPLRLTANTFDEASPGKIKTILVADVDVGQFRWEKQEDRYLNAVEFMLVVANRETDAIDRYDQTIEMDLRDETRAQLLASGMPILREFELAPGRYVAKLVVREKNTGHLGSVTHEFDVPQTGILRLSTPVLTDSLKQVPGQATPQLVMKAQRTFPAGTYLACQYQVYGAKAGDADGKPHVSGGYSILRADGTSAVDVPETPINAPSSTVARTVLFSLDDFAPGDYRLVLKVKDEVAGQAVENVVPFGVAEARAASNASK